MIIRNRVLKLLRIIFTVIVPPPFLEVKRKKSGIPRALALKSKITLHFSISTREKYSPIQSEQIFSNSVPAGAASFRSEILISLRTESRS